MKKLSAVLLTAMLSVSTATAGGLAPTIEVVEVTEAKPASSVSPLLILGLLILIGVLISRDNDDNEQARG